MGGFRSGIYTKKLSGKKTSSSINLGSTKGRGSVKRLYQNIYTYTRRNNNNKFYRFSVGGFFTRKNYT